MNIVELIVGDWSGDGHRQTCNLLVQTNITAKDIEKAYKEGTKKLGFNFIEEVCCDFEEDTVSGEYLEILKNQLDLSKCSNFLLEESEDYIVLSIKDYIEIYLAIIRYGDPFCVVFEKKVDVLKIGGYGLFWS